MHPYIFVYKVTRCNMHNLSAFEQELCIMEQTYPHPISERIFVLFALLTLKYKCLSNSRFGSIMTPMSFSSDVYPKSCIIVPSCRVYLNCSSSGLPKCITLHLSGWNVNNHFVDHAVSSSKSSCKIHWSLLVLIVLNTLVSSANMYISDFILFGRSFI